MLGTAGAVTVANIYFAQPLLDSIAHGFGASGQSASLVASPTQAGYAVGIALVVPLVDTARLPRLSAILLALTTVGLLAAALAPGLSWLALATLLFSATTVLPQLIMPTVAALAEPGRRGQVVGIVSTCVTLGSTVSRTVSGGVADTFGSWRASYVLAAAATGVLALLLPSRLPERLSPQAVVPTSYLRLLGSLPCLLRTHPELRLSAFLGAGYYGSFGAFWAVLPFHLSAPPFGWDVGHIGLFGLYCLPGAALSFAAGRLCDRFGPGSANVLSLVCMLAACALFGLASGSATVLVIGGNLVAFGVGSGQLANQARIFALGGEIRGRLNTVLMLVSFGGGSVGTACGAATFSRLGWDGLVLFCAVLAAVGVAALALTVVRPSRSAARPR